MFHGVLNICNVWFLFARHVNTRCAPHPKLSAEGVSLLPQLEQITSCLFSGFCCLSKTAESMIRQLAYVLAGSGPIFYGFLPQVVWGLPCILCGGYGDVCFCENVSGQCFKKGADTSNVSKFKCKFHPGESSTSITLVP